METQQSRAERENKIEFIKCSPENLRLLKTLKYYCKYSKPVADISTMGTNSEDKSVRDVKFDVE